MKLFYQYMAIFFNFSLTSSYLYPLQVKNCDSNLRPVVDDNGKARLSVTVDYSRYESVLIVDQITVIGNKMSI